MFLRANTTACHHAYVPPDSKTQRVARELAARIRDMQAGEDLGTVRKLGEDYEVGPQVMRDALNLLKRYGLVRAEARKHLVADPRAQMGDQVSLEERVADLEAWRAEVERRD